MEWTRLRPIPGKPNRARGFARTRARFSGLGAACGQLFHRPVATGPALHWGHSATYYTFLVTGEESGGAYFAMEALVPPDGSPPPHIHTREDETSYLLEPPRPGTASSSSNRPRTEDSCAGGSHRVPDRGQCPLSQNPPSGGVGARWASEDARHILEQPGAVRRTFGWRPCRARRPAGRRRSVPRPSADHSSRARTRTRGRGYPPLDTEERAGLDAGHSWTTRPRRLTASTRPTAAEVGAFPT